MKAKLIVKTQEKNLEWFNIDVTKIEELVKELPSPGEGIFRMKIEAIFKNMYSETLTLSWDTNSGIVRLNHSDVPKQFISLPQIEFTTFFEDDEVAFINSFLDICKTIKEKNPQFKLNAYLKFQPKTMSDLIKEMQLEEAAKLIGAEILEKFETKAYVLKSGDVYIEKVMEDWGRKITKIVKYPERTLVFYQWFCKTHSPDFESSCTVASFRTWMLKKQAVLLT